ncbi:hypothetical protein ABIB34_002343 [Rhodococcus sp. UYP5]
MRSRLVRIQLIALVVVTVAGIVFVGGKYVRIDNLLGFGQYRVHARIVFADPETPQPWDGKPKVDPDKLNLNPIASQLAPLVGASPR